MATTNVKNILERNSSELIPELDAAFLDNLDAALFRQETELIGNIGEEQERRGFFRSGQTQERVAREVIGPGIERRASALIGLGRESAQANRQERLGAEQFERTRQLAGEDFDRTKELEGLRFDRRLQELQTSSSIQEHLLRLQSDLEGGFDIFGQIAGGVAGTFLGGASGGAGANLGKRFFA